MARGGPDMLAYALVRVSRFTPGRRPVIGLALPEHDYDVYLHTYAYASDPQLALYVFHAPCMWTKKCADVDTLRFRLQSD